MIFWNSPVTTSSNCTVLRPLISYRNLTTLPLPHLLQNGHNSAQLSEHVCFQNTTILLLPRLILDLRVKRGCTSIGDQKVDRVGGIECSDGGFEFGSGEIACVCLDGGSFGAASVCDFFQAF